MIPTRENGRAPIPWALFSILAISFGFEKCKILKRDIQGTKLWSKKRTSMFGVSDRQKWREQIVETNEMPLCCKSRKRTPCPTACVTCSHFRILKKKNLYVKRCNEIWQAIILVCMNLSVVWCSSEYLNDYGNHIWLLHDVVRYLKYTCNHIWCKSNYFQVGAAVAVLPKTSCAFAMSGTIKLWKLEDISEHECIWISFFSRRISNSRLFKSSLFAVGGTVCAVSKTWPIQYTFANNPTLLMCYIIVENHLIPNML